MFEAFIVLCLSEYKGGKTHGVVKNAAAGLSIFGAWPKSRLVETGLACMYRKLGMQCMMVIRLAGPVGPKQGAFEFFELGPKKFENTAYP